jgi:hypothetical protein
MRRYLLLIGAIFLFSSGLNLVRLWTQRPDIWWTPAGMATPLAASGDRVKIYVRGEPLDDLLSKAQLQLSTESSVAAVAPSEVTLRFNNYDRVRAGRLPSVLSAGVGVGAALVLLVLGMVGLNPKPERPA